MRSTGSESLSQLDVLVVDCQATAAAPRGHLLELGWARAGPTPTRAVARIITLPTGARIPPAVMRLTGISEGMARDGVEAHTAWREVLAQPPSAASRRAANAAWDQLMSLERVAHETSMEIERDLELRDEGGELVPTLHFMLGRDPPTVHASFDNMPTDVLARLRRRRASGS